MTDGDGTFHIGYHNGKWNLVYKIALSRYNLRLLYYIKKELGIGSVNRDNLKGQFVIRDRKKLANIIFPIFDEYPLLTSNKICQFKHLLNCIENKDWDFHLKTRDKKFDLQIDLINSYNNSFLIPNYFKGWLSGFIEAEGCFRFRNGKATSFYISQNNDLYILNAIKTIFNSNHKIGIHKDLRTNQIHYRISISGKSCLTLIKNHFINYPLIGDKNLSYSKWSASI